MNVFFKSIVGAWLSVSLLTAAAMDNPNNTVQFKNLVRGGKKPQEVFTQEITTHPLVVVKCSMIGCSPCKKVAPVFEEIAHTFKERVRCIDLNIALFEEVIQTFNVKRVPTFLIFAQGKHFKTLKGSKKIHEIPRLLENQLRMAKSHEKQTPS